MPFFNHEQLPVYQQAISLITWVSDILKDRDGLGGIADRISNAAATLALKIAQADGRQTPADRSRLFEEAWGAALECAACLDVLVARKAISDVRTAPGKELLQSIVSVLSNQVAQ